MTRSRPYEESLYEFLKDLDYAAGYLTEHLIDDGPDSLELFLVALRDLAKVHGFAEVAARSGLGRESLYKALSSGGNPKFTTLRALLKAFGLKMRIEVDKNNASAKRRSATKKCSS